MRFHQTNRTVSRTFDRMDATSALLMARGLKQDRTTVISNAVEPDRSKKLRRRVRGGGGGTEEGRARG